MGKCVGCCISMNKQSSVQSMFKITMRVVVTVNRHMRVENISFCKYSKINYTFNQFKIQLFCDKYFELKIEINMVN